MNPILLNVLCQATKNHSLLEMLFEEKRNEYIEFSKKYSYEVKCIHATTSLDESYKRNKLSSDEKVVPKIAYSVYKKYYQEPTEEEGFVLYKID